MTKTRQNVRDTSHTRPQPMLPGRRCHFVVPWVAGPPANPHLLTTPWKPRSILATYTQHRHYHLQEIIPTEMIISK